MFSFNKFTEFDIPILLKMLDSQKFHLDFPNFIEIEGETMPDFDLFIQTVK